MQRSSGKVRNIVLLRKYLPRSFVTFIVILVILLLQELRDSLAQVSHQSIKIIVGGGIRRERGKWRLQRLPGRDNPPSLPVS